MKKNEIIEKLDSIKTIAISAATYGSDKNIEYKELRGALLNCTAIKEIIPLFIKSNLTVNEIRNYMQGLHEDYKSRRNYITEEINKAIRYIEEHGLNFQETIKYQETGWEKIDKSVFELKNSLENITDNISYNQIGVRCRQTISLLAQQIYDDKIHHPKDYDGTISKTDSKRMFDGYFDYCFPGRNNQEKRSYAKSCSNLANFLTHSDNLIKLDAKLCINATISLIQIIKSIDQETKK